VSVEKYDDRHMDEDRLTIEQFLFSKVTKGQFGWLAGIIDGDGNFYIMIIRKSDDTIAGFLPTIRITNTNPLIFRKVRSMGILAKPFAIKRRMKKDGSGLHKQAYDVRFCPRDLRFVLPKIIEELMAKKAQGRLMLEALDLLKTPKSEGRDKRLVEIHEEIKALNQKNWPLENWT